MTSSEEMVLSSVVLTVVIVAVTSPASSSPALAAVSRSIASKAPSDVAAVSASQHTWLWRPSSTSRFFPVGDATSSVSAAAAALDVGDVCDHPEGEHNGDSPAVDGARASDGPPHLSPSTDPAADLSTSTSASATVKATATAADTGMLERQRSMAHPSPLSSAAAAEAGVACSDQECSVTSDRADRAMACMATPAFHSPESLTGILVRIRRRREATRRCCGERRIHGGMGGRGGGGREGALEIFQGTTVSAVDQSQTVMNPFRLMLLRLRLFGVQVE